MIASEVMDLPEPDSPAMQSVSPRARENERSRDHLSLSIVPPHGNRQSRDLEDRRR